MPRKYEHLNQTDREIIAQMLKESFTYSAIAVRLGRSVSTIGREIRRNQNSDGSYSSLAAHRRCEKRKKIPRRPQVMTGATKRKVIMGLEQYWSPDQIHGRGDYCNAPLPSASSMYRFLATDEGNAFRMYMRCPDVKKTKRRKQKHQRIRDRVMITERPAEVEEKQVVGHWEGDTVRSPMRSRACVVTAVERKTHYLVAELLERCQARELNAALSKKVKALPFKTLTVDNGMEFARHKQLGKLTGSQVYFAHSGRPWERGLNEQINGLLRQFFPKGTDFRNVSVAQLRHAVDLLNNRPRKTLGYRTPKEVMEELLLCTCKYKLRAWTFLAKNFQSLEIIRSMRTLVGRRQFLCP